MLNLCTKTREEHRAPGHHLVARPATHIRLVTSTADDKRGTHRTHGGSQGRKPSMRVVIAMFKHETNTFSPVPTPLARFAAGRPGALL